MPSPSQSTLLGQIFLRMTLRTSTLNAVCSQLFENFSCRWDSYFVRSCLYRNIHAFNKLFAHKPLSLYRNPVPGRTKVFEER